MSAREFGSVLLLQVLFFCALSFGIGKDERDGGVLRYA